MSDIYEKIQNVRKPRVHIKYELETEEGVVEKELPFVVGVLGDYCGNNPGEKLKPLKDRKFIKINKDNFDQVMAAQKPGLKFLVEDAIKGGENKLEVDLQFCCMRDFEPASIVEKTPMLKELKEMRDKLRDLLSKADCSDKLEQILEDALQNPKKIESLMKDLSVDDLNKEVDYE